MTLTPLALRSRAVRDALVRRGMDVVHAEAAGRGLAPIAVVFDRITSDHCRLLLQAARRQGVESLTGDDWIVLAGSAARVAGLARPGVGTLPAWRRNWERLSRVWWIAPIAGSRPGVRFPWIDLG